MNVLVTGGCRGIGRAIVEQFLQRGHNVFVVDKDPIDAPCRVIQCDISKEGDAQRLSSLNIDCLVNNAGIIKVGNFEEQSPEEWMELIRTNLLGPMICSKIFSGVLKKNKGCIVNIISTHVFIPHDMSELGINGTVAYTATKSGLLGFTKALAVEYGKYGVRVNGICPGIVQTEMTKELFMDSITTDYLLKKIPLHNFTDKKDIADTVLFLAENKSITGEVIIVDGGFIATQ